MSPSARKIGSESKMNSTVSPPLCVLLRNLLIELMEAKDFAWCSRSSQPWQAGDQEGFSFVLEAPSRGSETSNSQDFTFELDCSIVYSW